MHYFVLVALLAASALLASANVIPPFSYSQYAGSNSGTQFTLGGEADERITAVRVWENGGTIRALQFKFGNIWSETIGNVGGELQEMNLDVDTNEAIIQISGKYSHYLNWVVFVTNRGRSLYAGQPSGTGFNMYPEHPGMELRLISGTYHSYLTGIGAHWAVVSPNSDSNEH